MVMPTSAGTFTSVTTAGYGDNTVQTAYDLFLRTALNSRPIIKNFVTVRPERQPHPGDAIVLQKQNHFSEATITAWKTALSEESDVTATKLPATTPVTLTPLEYGAAVATTKFLEGRTLAPFSQYTATELVTSAEKVIDEIVQDKIKADITELTVNGGAENTLANTHVMNAVNIRKQFTRFSENNVPKWDGEFYAAVLHPRQVHDLRSETGPGSWRVAKEYIHDGLIRVGGEVGEFEGFRFFSNNRVRKGPTGLSSETVYNAYFFGNGGLAEAVVSPFSTVVGPQVDNLRRVHTLGWHIDADWKVFEPLAIDIILSSSSLD